MNFSKNYETIMSEFLQNIEEMLCEYCMVAVSMDNYPYDSYDMKRLFSI